MARVGVCEDDTAVRGVVRGALELAGHRVVLAHDGREALSLFGPEEQLDVLVLDIGLPDADGRDLCQALRAAGQRAPVLFLTAFGATRDLVSGFHAGGDDYLVKPFEIAELQVRVAALSRRSTPDPDPGALPRLHLDPARHSVRGPTGEVTLTPTEFRLLASLAARPGEVVRRPALIAAGWPDGAHVSENTLDSFVRRVRVKLAESGAPVSLHTVRGVGITLR